MFHTSKRKCKLQQKYIPSSTSFPASYENRIIRNPKISNINGEGKTWNGMGGRERLICRQLPRRLSVNSIPYLNLPRALYGSVGKNTQQIYIPALFGAICGYLEYIYIYIYIFFFFFFLASLGRYICIHNKESLETDHNIHQLPGLCTPYPCSYILYIQYN